MPQSPDGSAPEQGRNYRDTLFLPETDFPMRAGLPGREPGFLEHWKKTDLYAQLRRNSKGRPPFVLHDGPPYANGHIHMGTALTKVLKDIIVRSRQMTGYDANFVPGWDCHGLPVEWKVEEEFRAKGRAKKDIPPTEFRTACRQYARKWLDIQREEFIRLGGCGDWDNPYTTMDFAAEASIACELMKFAAQGLVYRGSRPVMWSPVEQTALAEAEIEYHDRQSTAIWVKFPLLSGSIPHEHLHMPPGRTDSPETAIAIWTTTPWTIPANRAICYGPELSYGLYRIDSSRDDLEFRPWPEPGTRLILCDRLAESVLNAAFAAKWTRLADIPVPLLEKAVCTHPLKGHAGGYGFDVPLLAGSHVTAGTGTGFVHTAPGHGQDDYLVWTEKFGQQADIPHTVDESGTFTDEAPGFEGAKVLITEGKKKGRDGDAGTKVIDALLDRNMLLARSSFTHSYPHSWRSKAPVIFRNTPQWFIALDKPSSNGRTLRENALSAIDATGFTPPQARNRLRSMVEKRPDWLISRQRAWGVPITLFVHGKSGEILCDTSVNKRITDAVRENGADSWFEKPSAEFLGSRYSAGDYEKVTDILDVWFDSGSTHAFVLEDRDELSWPADVYCEGSDQHRGWFQSSLLESCGTRGRAPYKHVVTNGFVVDGQGRKMSKSLGNVVAPQDIIRTYGAEIIRIWTASSDYTQDMRVSSEITGSAVDSYRKLRNTIRYLLGALHGFTDSERVRHADMPELERYILHRVRVLDEDIRAAYENFALKDVWRKCTDFTSADLSAFYFDIRKDSLYCDDPEKPDRRATRTVMDIIFERLVCWLAPICIFTMEEARTARYPASSGSVHLEQFPGTPATWRNDDLEEKWNRIREVRHVVTGALEIERAEKRIGASLEAAPRIHVDNPAYSRAFDGLDAAGIFITSGARITTSGPVPASAFRLEDNPAIAVLPEKAAGKKCSRCWKILPDVGRHEEYPDLCGRCADVVSAHDAKNG